MAEILISQSKLQHNFDFLNALFSKRGIQWGIVTKLLCGNPNYIKMIIGMGASELMDSRISNLKTIKRIDPGVRTIYIKPPPRRSIQSLVKYADVSLNSDLDTLRLISEEARKQRKIHQVIIMVEMGELREGVLGDSLIPFYEQVFQLPNIDIVGLGTNLNCLNGVMPSHDKLIQLSLYKQIIEVKFGRKITYLSGGTSVTIPMLFKDQVPQGVNHFRVGETLYFGADLFSGNTIKGMKDDVISFQAEIIELIEKPKVPEGNLSENPSGDVFSINPSDYGKKTWRALLDIGLLDINPDYLIPIDKHIKIVGASSDILVVDLGQNKRYKTGDFMKFRLKYMGALGLFNSGYIIKRIID